MELLTKDFVRRQPTCRGLTEVNRELGHDEYEEQGWVCTTASSTDPTRKVVVPDATTEEDCVERSGTTWQKGTGEAYVCVKGGN
eukprot:SAG31_NODE_47261_length_251_cov_0.677632_1_plen_83_part_11